MKMHEQECGFIVSEAGHLSTKEKVTERERKERSSRIIYRERAEGELSGLKGDDDEKTRK